MMSNVDTGNSSMVFGDDEANFKTLAPAGQASRGPLEHTPHCKSDLPWNRTASR